jgi:hypothetical protein
MRKSLRAICDHSTALSKVPDMPPTPEHEALHRIFQEDPGLFARTMARALNLDLPEPSQVKELSVDLSEFRPVVERRADSVLQAEFLIENPVGRYILVVESQTVPKEHRRKRWPYYIAFLRDKYDCPVVLLVVCSKAATAAWAREPIRIGLPDVTCMTVTPIVLGPDNVPAVITVEEAASDLPFAVFSALTHSRGRNARAILEVLAVALDTTDTETAAMYAEFTEAGLGDTPGLQIWRALMAIETFPYSSQLRSKGREEGHAEGRAEGRKEGRAEGRAEGRVEGRAEGRAQGEAAAILRILERRKVEVDDGSRERIESCTDLELLGTWLDRSLDVEAVDELFV